MSGKPMDHVLETHSACGITDREAGKGYVREGHGPCLGDTLSMWDNWKGSR